MATSTNKTGKYGDLNRRLVFLLLALVVYRVGAHIPVPGIDPQQLQQLFKDQPATVQFFAGQQEFHGRKTYGPVAQATEDMNQDWQQYQRSTRQKKGRIQKELRKCGHEAEQSVLETCIDGLDVRIADFLSDPSTPEQIPSEAVAGS